MVVAGKRELVNLKGSVKTASQNLLIFLLVTKKAKSRDIAKGVKATNSAKSQLWPNANKIVQGKMKLLQEKASVMLLWILEFGNQTLTKTCKLSRLSLWLQVVSMFFPIVCKLQT